MGRIRWMTAFLATAILLTSTLVGVSVGVSAAHDENCDTGSFGASFCSETWTIPETPDPTWWSNPGFSGHDQEAVWLALETKDPSEEAIRIEVEAFDGAVASLDIFLQRDENANVGHTAVTPTCPQKFVFDFYPDGPGEDVGSPGHVNQVLRLTHVHHQTILPEQKTTVDLDRDQTWVAVIDARGGTSAADGIVTGDSAIKYTVDGNGDDFIGDTLHSPDRPFDISGWNETCAPTDPPLPPIPSI